MAELKTKKNESSVDLFLSQVENPKRREDALKLLKIFEKVTGENPKMWGDSIVGFGQYHYVYESGREGDWPITGFSPRKQNLSLYIMPGAERFQSELGKLGKYKLGKSCLYFNKLEDVNIPVLEELIRKGMEYMKSKYGS